MKMKKIQNTKTRKLIFSRTAQLEIMQTVFILLFIFVILFAVFIFAITQERNSRQKQLDQSLILVEQKKSQSINYLTEINCIKDNVIIKDCFDKLSIKSFKTRVNEDMLYYNSILGTVNIKINEYIEGTWNEEILFENKKEVYDTIKKYQFPITIYDPINNINNYGVLHIEIYN
jgi:hypothetical protein